MNDLISRQAAIEETWKEPSYTDPLNVLAELRDRIKDLPSAQPEIIRCKDCKYRTSYWGNCKLLEEKYHQSVLVDDDGFCSMAERREE